MPIYNNFEQEIEGLQAVLDAKSPLNHAHTPEAWQSLSLASGWSSYSTSVPNPQYRKFLNLVEIKGTIIKSTAVSANEIIATLPVGYRPNERRYFITWNINSYSRLQIDSDGSIRVSTAGGNTVVGLDVIFGLG